MDSYFGYKPCFCCGKYADDGTYDKESWYCLDCADKRPNAKEIVDLLVLITNKRQVAWSDIINNLKEVE